MEHQIRVMLADDQRLIREGLRIILEADSDILIVGEAGDGGTAVALAVTKQPDVILMDIRMPTQDGIVTTYQVKQRCPNIRIILLTMYDSPDLVVEGVRAGATGYLLKDCCAEELRNAVRAVARGQHLLQTISATRLLADFTLNRSSPVQGLRETFGLTQRELDILPLIARGDTNREIAARLYISQTTVKTHVNHIFAKLGARDRVHAVALIYQFGLLV